MDETIYQEYINRLRDRLLRDPDVLGLIITGSTTDAARRDDWSDHDFWIVTQPRTQVRFLDDLTWLPAAENILLTARYGLAYRTVLYRNRHKVDFAVFDPEQAAGGTLERFQVLIDRQDVRALAIAAQERSAKERTRELQRHDAFEGFGILLWSAYQRSARGEVLSGRQFFELALDALLNMLVVSLEPDQSSEDWLDPRRRLEQRRPEWAQEIQRCCSLPLHEACVALFDVAERLLRPVAAESIWSRIAVLRQWFEESGMAP